MSFGIFKSKRSRTAEYPISRKIDRRDECTIAIERARELARKLDRETALLEGLIGESELRELKREPDDARAKLMDLSLGMSRMTGNDGPAQAKLRGVIEAADAIAAELERKIVARKERKFDADIERCMANAKAAIAEADALIFKLRREGLNADRFDTELRQAKEHLDSAGRRFDQGDDAAAAGLASTSLRFAIATQTSAGGLLDEKEKTSAALMREGGRIATMKEAVAANRIVGARARKAPKAAEFTAVIQTYEAADKRVADAEELLKNASEAIGRNDLETAKLDTERAKAWLDQALGCIRTTQALDGYLACPEDDDKPRSEAVFVLMECVFTGHANDIQAVALAAQAQARSLSKGDLHEELIAASLQALALASKDIDAACQRRTVERYGPMPRTYFSSPAYRLDALDDRFPPAEPRAPAKPAPHSTSWHYDGPCTCH